MTSVSGIRLPWLKNITFLVLICTGYAAASLLAQIEFPAWGNSGFSPIELALWLAIFAGVLGTIAKLSIADQSGVSKRYWTLATIAIISISVLESADWFADSRNIWQTAGYETLGNFFKAALAIIIAAAVYWSSNLPREYAWGARCLKATVVFQFLSMILETTHFNHAVGKSYGSPQFIFPTEFAELLCIEFYILWLALTRAAKTSHVTLLGAATAGSFVGANARQAYHDCALHNGAKHPPIALAFYPGFQEATIFLITLWLAFTTGPVIKRAKGKSIALQIREMTQLWFRDGIDPPSYYALDLYDWSKSDWAPHYLTRFETKNGLFHALNSYQPSPYPISEMNNKILFAACCAKFGIPHARPLLTVSGGQIEWHCQETELHTDIFCKRQHSMGAIGTFTFRYQHPGVYLNDTGEELKLTGMLGELRQNSFKHPLLVQPWLRNHPSISDLALDSLITMRVLTCMNEFGNPEVTLAMLRLLAKLEPRWQHLPDEEYAAPINLLTGELGLFTGDNVKTSHLRYENHLVTGAPIKGRVLHDWTGICSVAKAAHMAFPHRLLVGWDIALTDKGPMVLEGNTNLDVMFLQRVHDGPIGQSRFGELLNHHLKNLYGRKMSVWHG